MDNKKNIMLVPTDFSDTANFAMNHAIQIAKIFDNEIALLHINNTNIISGLMSKSHDELVQEAIMSRLRKIKDEVWEEHKIQIIPVTKSAGSIYKTIVETAEELDCDSIVMGTHGAEGIKKIIGSNSSRVISHSEVPVIVVKESPIGEGYKNIVLPIDLTFETRQKVRWAIHLGKKFNSTIHILTFKETDEFLSNKIHANTVKVEQQLTEANIPYTVTFTEEAGGSFAKETIRFAEEKKADLIMIMTQQEEGFTEYIIGSYAQQIVNSSPIPVMTVTPTTKGILDVVRAI